MADRSSNETTALGEERLSLREGQLRAAAEARTERIRRLEGVTEAVLSHLALDDLLDELVERICETFGVDTVAILLSEPGGEWLTVRAAKGLEEEVERGIRIPLGQGFAGRVAAERRPVVVEDLDRAQLVSPFLREKGIRALLGVPLLVHGRVIGVLHVGTLRDRVFTKEEAQLLELVAGRTAFAIDHARLFEEQRAARAEAEATRDRLSFLSEASALLASSLDYETTLSRVAELAVPQLADWCVIDIVADDGSLRRLAVAHVDPAKVAWAHELERKYPPDPNSPRGVPNVIRTGRSELMAEISDAVVAAAARDEEHLRLLRRLGLSSYMCVPLVARARTLGAITFVAAESGRRYGPGDLALAEDLSRRAAVAVDNARLYDEAEKRAQAAQVLDTVADGVFLLDGDGRIRLWNRGAEAITGLAASAVVGQEVDVALRGWGTVAERIPVTSGLGRDSARSATVPLQVSGRELWLSVSGVGFTGGTVYAFRDVTDERAFEQLRSDLIATVSHELRTPLAAVYGAALTLRREDVALGEEQRSQLLALIATESERLTRIVNDILLATRLEAGTLRVSIESCDAGELAGRVIAAARAQRVEGIELRLSTSSGVPPVAADPDKVSQVLTNLVDNAVKYSPDGGEVEVGVEVQNGHVRFSVRDRGLGIPPAEQRRVFEKFYRLDPNLTRGIGGTGLGLYISRELVQRMGGRMWVSSAEGRGSTFFFELPAAAG